jgi:hypothetical protein
MERFRLAAVARGAEQMSAHEISAATKVLASVNVRTVVLVEGASDRAALETLAARRGRDLDAERVCVVPLGGATNISRFLDLLGPRGLDVRLAGLCDAAEERYFQRALQRAGMGSNLNLNRARMEALGFYVCVDDLEDELIRCLGAAFVERVIDAQGDLPALRTFQRQPAQRGRTVEQQLRRFLGTISGRKIQYARSIVDDLDLAQVPRPLDHLLEYI